MWLFLDLTSGNLGSKGIARNSVPNPLIAGYTYLQLALNNELSAFNKRDKKPTRSKTKSRGHKSPQRVLCFR